MLCGGLAATVDCFVRLIPEISDMCFSREKKRTEGNNIFSLHHPLIKQTSTLSVNMMNLLLILLSVSLLCLFPCAVAFAPVVVRPSRTGRVGRLARAVEDEYSGSPPQPPQYDKIQGFLGNVQHVAEGSVLLHINVPHDSLDYQPGHVLALELEDTSPAAQQTDDTQRNGGWMRGPYTVSRCTKHSLDLIVRVVGKKSRALAAGNIPVRFGGTFKVPILDGIHADAQRVVLISTGVGIGPCLGAIELALQPENKNKHPPMQLFACFREASEVILPTHLDQLAQEHPDKFQWTPIVTSQTGRISASQENLKDIFESAKELTVNDTHYHLIGNGQMVNEWRKGLNNGGVPKEYVTFENYFNTFANVDEQAIENIAQAVAAHCGIQA